MLDVARKLLRTKKILLSSFGSAPHLPTSAWDFGGIDRTFEKYYAYTGHSAAVELIACKCILTWNTSGHLDWMNLSIHFIMTKC